MTEWNQGDLDSFLIEISADVLQQKDPVTGKPFVDVVLDTRRPEGHRQVDERQRARPRHPGGVGRRGRVRAPDLGAEGRARRARRRCCSGRQGLGNGGRRSPSTPCATRCTARSCAATRRASQLYAQASQEYKWNLNLGAIAQIFRGGCIIRARFLQKITEAFEQEREPRQPAASIRTSSSRSRRRRTTGARSSPARRSTARRCRCSRARCRTTTAIAPRCCRRTCCRRSATTSARTPTSASTQPRGKFFHIDWPDPKRPQLKSSELGMSR